MPGVTNQFLGFNEFNGFRDLQKQVVKLDVFEADAKQRFQNQDSKSRCEIQVLPINF